MSNPEHTTNKVPMTYNEISNLYWEYTSIPDDYDEPEIFLSCPLCGCLVKERHQSEHIYFHLGLWVCRHDKDKSS